MWELREVPADLRKRYLDAGWWTGSTLGAFIEAHVASQPELPVTVWSATHSSRSTIGQLDDQARRVAGALAERGLGAGDVVAYQLPNWAEAISVLWAGFHLGAVLVPIAHHYGGREVEFILRQSRARALITVDRFGHVDHLANLVDFRPRLDVLEQVIVVPSGAPGPGLPGAIRLAELQDAEPIGELARVDPDTPAMVGYTSGTSADPKGVVHTHRSLIFEIGQCAGMDPWARPLLSASPIAHMTGMLSAHLMALLRRQPIHLTDRWNPTEALRIIMDEDISSGTGATVFLTDLMNHPDFTQEHARRIGSAGLGGSPVPAAVAERADDAGIRAYRSYGSSEHPSVTGSRTDEPRDKRCRTDGHPLVGVEVRVVEPATERELGTGSPGEVWTRGPDLFAGYSDPKLTARAFTPDGWYRTGDVGILDDDGYLTITDRLGDLIIRGGTNLSAAEIEEALVRVRGIAECAVVAAPDHRLGERAVAFVRLQPGALPVELDAVQRALGDGGLPRTKWIEGLRVVEDFPRTPSGKIRKFVLRDELRRDEHES